MKTNTTTNPAANAFKALCLLSLITLCASCASTLKPIVNKLKSIENDSVVLKINNFQLNAIFTKKL